MKKLFSLSLACVLLLTILVSTKATVDEVTVERKWNEFKGRRGLRYRNSTEENEKKLNFAYHYRRMVEASKQVSFELKTNDHFTEEPDVFSKMKGLDPPPPDIEVQITDNFPTTTKTTTTTSLNSRNKLINTQFPGIVLNWAALGYVTPVKNQGKCGSCWAFAAVGALEAQLYKKKNGRVPVTALSLSEQNLIDCTTANHGCNGGWPAKAWAQIASEGGIDSAASYPYTGTDGVCRFNPANVIGSDKGTAYVQSGNETALLNALRSVGPISVSIDSDHTSFHAYGSGIYSERRCDTEQHDHAVLLVGYGTNNGHDYWLLKNSWGTSWGIQGFMMMARNAGNMCGIASHAMYPLV